MDTKFESWKITDFNLNGQINLGNKFGLIKIMRSDDGTLILVGDAEYGVIDQEKPSTASFLRPDSILAFVLDIGIQREKMLSRESGFYFGIRLIREQSLRVVSQKDFDENIFEKIGFLIDSYSRSGDKPKETEAIRLQLLFDAYNDARLLFPNFYAESYLTLMRIIEAIGITRGGYDFASFAATISSRLNQDIYQKLNAIYKDRIEKATELFNICLLEANQKGWKCYDKMVKLDIAGKVIFACFYSAYQYRNKFVHLGFPFPDTVKDSIGLGDDSGTAYLNPALGISWTKIHRPDGLQEGDLIDIHQVVSEEEFKKFKDIYFQLLPTWYFMKRFTREALLNHVEELGKQ